MHTSDTIIYLSLYENWFAKVVHCALLKFKWKKNLKFY